MNEYDVISKFKDRPFITKKELFEFLDNKKNELSDSYYRLLLSNLRKKGIIEDLRRNRYSINVKPNFCPVIDKTMRKIVVDIKKQTNGIQYVCWNSLWLNRFTVHQSNSSLIIFECEKEYIETVYYILKDKKYHNLYLNPKKDVINIYISENNSSIIVLPLISRSPSLEYEGIVIPSIEKILVDVFSDNTLFYAYQGEELKNIFNNTISDFKVNFSTLFNYAKRRNKYDDIIKFIRDLSILDDELLIGVFGNDK